MKSKHNLFSQPDTILVRRNLQLARKRWGSIIDAAAKGTLRDYSATFLLSIERGDLILIDGKWYVTHSGLLRLAARRHCSGIHAVAVPEFCDPPSSRWTFKATIYRSPKCKGFVGYGDADPSNVSRLVRGAEMRVAETRAVNRALRKAYGIGLCSVEEIGALPAHGTPVRKEPKRQPQRVNGSNGSNGNGSLRDRLSQLIRQHQLNPALVKLYATEYCGTKELREAKRDQIESFVNHLTQTVLQNRDALVCQLNSYSQKDAGTA